MAYGFLALNNSGAVQVDENYSNYKVIASGTATGKSVVYFTDYGVVPLIMVRPVTLGTWITGYGQITTSSFNTLCGNSTTQVQYYYKVLVPVSSVTASGESFGLRVFNSANTLMFDSGHTDQLRISTVADVTPSTSTTYVTTPTSSGSYYVSLNPCNLYFVGDNINNLSPWLFLAVRQTTENAFEVVVQTMTNGPGIGFDRGSASTIFFFGTFL